MKNPFFFVFIFIFTAASFLTADEYDSRIDGQLGSIDAAVKSGDITAAFALELKTELGDIGNLKIRMMSDGIMSPDERKQIGNRLDVSEDNFRKKHRKYARKSDGLKRNTSGDPTDPTRKSRSGADDPTRDITEIYNDEIGREVMQKKRIDEGTGSGELVEDELAKILVKQAEIKRLVKRMKNNRAAQKMYMSKLKKLNDEIESMIYEYNTNIRNAGWQKIENAIGVGVKDGEITGGELTVLNAKQSEIEKAVRLMMLDRKIGKREQNKLDDMIKDFNKQVYGLSHNANTVMSEKYAESIKSGARNGSLTKPEVRELMSALDSLMKAREIIIVDDRISRRERRELKKMEREFEDLYTVLTTNDETKRAKAKKTVKKAVKKSVKKTTKTALKKTEEVKKEQIYEIKLGIAEGELTDRELLALKNGLAEIEIEKRKMMRDGRLSEYEKEELDEMQDKLTRKIERMKNNRHKKWWQFWL